MLLARGSSLPRSVSDINDSVVELAYWAFSLMSTIPTLHPMEENEEPYFECDPRVRFAELKLKIVDSIQKVAASYLTPFHKEHMAKQRAKTGLELPTEEDRNGLVRSWMVL